MIATQYDIYNPCYVSLILTMITIYIITLDAADTADTLHKFGPAVIVPQLPQSSFSPLIQDSAGNAAKACKKP